LARDGVYAEVAASGAGERSLSLCPVTFCVAAMSEKFAKKYVRK
jgi:hypothetical protein